MSSKKKFYSTWQEASDAFQRVIELRGIDKSKSKGGGFTFYSVYYKDDHLLPSRPNNIYGDVWEKNGSYDGFFQLKPEEIRKYTFEEAVKAVQNLRPVPKTRKEYHLYYDQDSRLWRSPEEQYTNEKTGVDFEKLGGWDKYLLLAEIYTNPNPRFYESAEIALEAVRKLGIKNVESYRTGYRLDPRLPPILEVYYGPYTFKNVFGKKTLFN